MKFSLYGNWGQTAISLGHTLLSLLAFLSAWLLLASVGAAEAEPLADKGNPKFIELLTYEIQNRAFAFESAQRAVDRGGEEPIDKVWVAYLALEQMNQKKYQPMAEKYGISQEATFSTKLKIAMDGVFKVLMPETALNVVRDATVAYVEQLEELEGLAGSEDKEFFHYVVLQEKIQAQTLTLLADGKPEEGAEVMEVFVAQWGTDHG